MSLRLGRGPPSTASLSVSCTTSSPAAGIAHRSVLPPRLEMKVIHSPSGVQTGAKSLLSSSLVARAGSTPAAGTSKRRSCRPSRRTSLVILLATSRMWALVCAWLDTTRAPALLPSTTGRTVLALRFTTSSARRLTAVSRYVSLASRAASRHERSSLCFQLSRLSQGVLWGQHWPTNTDCSQYTPTHRLSQGLQSAIVVCC